MVSDQSYKTNLKKAAFIVKEYPTVLDKNDIKNANQVFIFKNFR
jgi:hypothetical protein